MFDFDLSQDIFKFLQANPDTRELDIIRHLQSLGRLPKSCLSTDLALFRSHFLVFNGLYRLQHQGAVRKNYTLNISALSITLLPWAQGGSETCQSLSNTDPLFLFYTDWDQLNQTDSQDVQALLTRFWQHYIDPASISQAEKEQALSVLELSEPVDFPTIKQQYRRLAMRHHPDRGGDPDKLVSINQAMQCLQSIYAYSY